MKKFYLFIALLLWALTSQAMEEQPVLAKTSNGFGFNFSHLGSHDQQIFDEITNLVRSANAKGQMPNALFVGEAFGFLPIRIMNYLTGDVLIYVNDLSSEHLNSFNKSKKAMVNANQSQPDSSQVKNAVRAQAVAGDCLDEKTIKQYGDTKFDIIVANNLLVFFDGEQIFNFLLLHFNLLRPGAKLFLFFDGRFGLPTRDEIASSKPPHSYSILRNIINHRIATFAYRHTNDIIFPALQSTRFLSDKFTSRELKDAFDIKYVSPLANHIFHEEFEKLAIAIGYEISSRKYYQITAKQKGYSCDELAIENQKVGLILQKPKDFKVDARVLKSDLNQNLVATCKESSLRLQKFIDDHLIFKDIYPFVEMKSDLPEMRSICHNLGCIKESPFTCGKCGKAKYCGSTCQRRHWQTHKQNCKNIPPTSVSGQ